jgi:hypothetical protein
MASTEHFAIRPIGFGIEDRMLTIIDRWPDVRQICYLSKGHCFYKMQRSKTRHPVQYLPFLTRNLSTPTRDRLEAYPTLVSGVSSDMKNGHSVARVRSTTRDDASVQCRIGFQPVSGSQCGSSIFRHRWWWQKYQLGVATSNLARSSYTLLGMSKLEGPSAAELHAKHAGSLNAMVT